MIIFSQGLDNPGGVGHHGQPPGPLHLQPLPQQWHLGGPRPGLLRQASDKSENWTLKGYWCYVFYASQICVENGEGRVGGVSSQWLHHRNATSVRSSSKNVSRTKLLRQWEQTNSFWPTDHAHCLMRVHWFFLQAINIIIFIFLLHCRVSCEQCILQWTYTAGNNWGTCANGTGSLGCGPQVRFICFNICPSLFHSGDFSSL